MDNTQYKYRMPMDHFGEANWYTLRPSHTWMDDKPLYPVTVLHHKRPKAAGDVAGRSSGVLINDNTAAPQFSFLYGVADDYNFITRYVIDDYDGETLIKSRSLEIKPGRITGHDKISDNLYYSHIGGNTYKTENGQTALLHQSPVHTVYRGVKYLNENIAVKSTRLPNGISPDFPSASITLDGGRTWQRLDFSQLALPRDVYGSDYHYGGCIVVTYGEIIEIRYHVMKLKEKGYTLDDNYSIISQDGGMTWTGYIRTTGTQLGKEDQSGFHYLKVTETIPATVKTA